MTDIDETLRPGASRLWCIAGWAVGAGLVAAEYFTGSALGAVKELAIILLLAYLLWLLLWSPSVTLSSSGLGVRNLLRTYQISWPAVLELPLGMSLMVVTASRKIAVAAAPGRGIQSRGRGGAYSRMAEGSSDVAFRIRAYWQKIRTAAPKARVLDSRDGVVAHWLVTEITILIVLLAVAVLVPVLLR